MPSITNKARRSEGLAVSKVLDLHHRRQGAQRRVERAQQELDDFATEHARDLLAEREAPAREVALNLTRLVNETVRTHQAYIAMRQEVDRLVAYVPTTVRVSMALMPWERD
jgi:vacuolar-type H+-ATPase subunit I/STV1